MHYRHFAWIATFATLAVAPPLDAQTPHTISVRTDNDAFDFWQAPANRPDEEYTSGVRISVSGGDIPGWARGLAGGLPLCTPGGNACRSQSWDLGQDIYSAARNADGEAVRAGLRPNAGWLYGTETARVLRATRLDELAITIGVTGPPALARNTQNFFHGLVPDFNRPTDWRDQVKFEPGINLQYTLTRRVVLGDGERFGVDADPSVRLAAGTVLTAAEAGLHFRAGYHLQHPWLPPSDAAPVEIAFALGGTARGVLRDVLLDGSTIQNGANVGHQPFVYAWNAALSARYRWLSLSYGAETDSRSYRNGPATHTWGSLRASVTLNY